MRTNTRRKKIRFTSILAGSFSALVLATPGSARAATWAQKAQMPTARSWLSTSVVHGKIYAIGGIGGVNKVEEYDPATDTWTEKTDMPTGRTMLATSVVNGKIYAIGGQTHWPGGGAEAKLGAVEAYDPVTDAWTRKADLPTPRSSLATSVVNGRIYAIGGNRDLQLSTVEEYDPRADTWTKKADMPTARTYLATCVVNGKIYAIGGIPADAWPAFSTVEAYDPVTDTWTQKAYMPAPSGALRTSVVNDEIYVFGGARSRGGIPLSTLFQYDPSMDTWTSREDMPVILLGMGASAVGKRIYVIGGSSASYPYNPSLATVWEFIPQPEFDFNEDGIVDARDVSLMVDHWHTNAPRYDLAPAPAGDGVVDVQDLILLSEHLFEDDRTIAHWTLDEMEGLTAHDSLGVNDGFVVGNPVWLPDGGQVGGTIELDGIDDHVGTPFVWDPAEGPFSVFAWVQGGAPGQVIVSQQGGADWLATDASAGALSTGLHGNSRSSGPLVSEAVVTDGQWHHVGFTWDGSDRILYVDDLEVARDTQSNLAPSPGGLYIGVGSTGSDAFFSGLIDDVRIYDRAVYP